MNLTRYKKWYINNEGHLYLSKVKQYNKSSMNLYARGLNLINHLCGEKPNQEIYDKYLEFGKNNTPGISLFVTHKGKNRVPKNKVSKLFLALEIIAEDLIQTTEHQDILADYLEEKNYNYLYEKYSNSAIDNVEVQFRNFTSWCKKLGFQGWYKQKLFFLTEAGIEFSKHCDDEDITDAIFLNQIKKLQHWNPTIKPKKRYGENRVFPYYLMLQILLKLPSNYFTKEEYALFITTIKSHDDKEIQRQINLINNFRDLSDDEREKYKAELRILDKKVHRNRARTNWTENLDSAGKEISAYCYSNLTDFPINTKYGVSVNLKKSTPAALELEEFNSSIRFIDFDNETDSIEHHGFMELDIEDIIDLYLKDYGDEEETLKRLVKAGKSEPEAKRLIFDRLFEIEVEKYFCKHLDEISVDLEIIRKPDYGRQFTTPIGIIDLLCKDKKTGKFIVIEFKRGRGEDEVVGQILRYMGWVYINLAKTGDDVKGIIVCRSTTDKLEHAIFGTQSDLISIHEHSFDDENRPVL
jgi:hypothetical protein